MNGRSLRRSLYTFVACFAASAHPVMGLNEQHVRDAIQSVRHDVVIELPQSLTLSDGPIEVAVGGQERVRMTHSQPIAVELVQERAEVTVHYPSGLRLSTVVRWSDLRLQLPELSTTSFTVVDSTGMGVPNASIRAKGGAGRFAWDMEVTTSSQGYARLPHPRGGGGRVAVCVHAIGYGSYAGDVELGAAQHIGVSLRASAAVVGTVKFGDDESRARLQAWELSEGRRRTLDVSVSGSFVHEDLPAGLYDFVFVVPYSGALAISRVFVGPGTTVDLGIVDLDATGSLSGIVRARTNEPVPGVRVRLSAAGIEGGTTPEAYTDMAGRFVFPALLPGEYTPELYSPSVGWRVLTERALTVYQGERLSEVFEFEPSGCALRIEFVAAIEEPTASYTIMLPVTDGSITARVETSEQRFYPSVPCGGVATVMRSGAEGPVHATTLGPGESHLVIQVGDQRRYRDVRVTVGGRPVARAWVWAMVRDRMEVAFKGRSHNMTDDDGRAMLELPEAGDLTLYIETAGLLSIVEHVGSGIYPDSLELDLPNRVLRVVVRDRAGRPVTGTFVDGNRLPDGSGYHNTGMPSAVVTSFTRGVTDASGVFEASGLGDGRWMIRLSGNRIAHTSAEATFRPSQRTVSVDVTVDRQ